MEVERPGEAPKLLVRPRPAGTGMFFEVAARAGVVLTHFKRDEEDLERLFFRVTDQHPPPVHDHAAAGLAEGVAHGN